MTTHKIGYFVLKVVLQYVGHLANDDYDCSQILSVIYRWKRWETQAELLTDLIAYLFILLFAYLSTSVCIYVTSNLISSKNFYLSTKSKLT
jgi:hypothetical protein